MTTSGWVVIKSNRLQTEHRLNTCALSRLLNFRCTIRSEIIEQYNLEITQQMNLKEDMVRVGYQLEMRDRTGVQHTIKFLIYTFGRRVVASNKTEHTSAGVAFKEKKLSTVLSLSSW